jgi:hypothetical protein
MMGGVTMGRDNLQQKMMEVTRKIGDKFFRVVKQ